MCKQVRNEARDAICAFRRTSNYREFHQLVVSLHIPAHPTLEKYVIAIGGAPDVVRRMFLRQLPGGINKAEVSRVEAASRNGYFWPPKYSMLNPGANNAQSAEPMRIDLIGFMPFPHKK